MSQISTSRALKNTFFLYFRMLLIMGVSLYTSRIVLRSLGVEDFGIYNVVGGVITMFGFLNGAMASGTQRFLAMDLGNGNYSELKKTFNLALVVHVLIGLCIVLLGETLGLWFLNTHLVIPAERIVAANWVYQFSIATFFLTIIQVPFNALLIARERMHVYAYMSFLDVGLKLVVVLLLTEINFDKLKLYGVLMFGVTLCITLSYRLYCRVKFQECRFELPKDLKKAREILFFSGWNLSAHVVAMLSNQGVNMMLNMFFGPAINAARGIALQVSMALQNFVNGFQSATAPQITKSFAAKEIDSERKLILQVCKFSYYLFFSISLVVFLEVDFILSLWLGQIPEHSSSFLRIIILEALVMTSANPMYTAIMATGKIAFYQIVCSLGVLINFIVAYVLLSFGFPPETVFWQMIVVQLFLMWRRLKFLKKEIGLETFSYAKYVVCPVLLVTAFTLPLPVIAHWKMTMGIERLFLVGLSCVFCSLISISMFGLSHRERAAIRSKLGALFFNSK